MKVSPETARRALAMLEQHDDHAGRAAHDMDVSLRAIEPYTDAATERVMRVLRRLAMIDRERRDTQGQRWRDALRDISASQSV